MNGTFTRAVCVGCDKVRSIYGSRGYCRTCAQTSLDVEDNESPSVLTGHWVPHPSLPIRVYVEQVAS